MDDFLNRIIVEIYNKCKLQILNFKVEEEGKEYNACRFKLNRLMIVSRNAKLTPKKDGQFVTFWKRNRQGIIEPLHESDRIDFYVVTVKTESKFGQFVFPRSTLIQNGIISTDEREGKRGFRLYSNWDKTNNKQAIKTQKWQLDYFYEINKTIDLNKVVDLFKKS
ncbi:MAG: MepB family protein [Flavobacteriales bacterium]|nr:MepB family protein [Flavobacteriales bacterium]